MNKLICVVVVCLLLFGIGKQAKAQKDKVWGSWAITNLEYEFAKNFIFYFELQGRSQAVFNHFNYYEIKGGFNYRINKNFSTLVGFGNYGTYNWKNLRSAKTTDELRLWEQFVISQPLNRLKFEHRFRAEQASINGRFRNRFRYRINLVVPINKKKVEKGTVFASAFDEIFLTDTPPYFMRNRIYIGIGYQINKFLTIQSGWVNQFNYNLVAKGGKNNLLVSLNFRFLRKDNVYDRIPSLKD